MKTSKLLSTLALVLALGPGCSYYATSHVPYTPMLNRGGQMDVSVRTGASYPGGLPVAVNAAVAPVDGFEILANADFNLGSSARHYGGGLAIGTFVPTDVFRLEFIGGVNGGYSEGSSYELDSSSGTTIGRNYGLTGGYLQPFGQLLLGFELTHFLFAAGVRVQGFLSSVSALEIDGVGTYATTGYERAYVEPVVTVQFPFDFVRVEVTSSLPIYVAGDAGPTPASVDSTFQWYLAVGVGFQWEAFGESAEDATYEPSGAYVPGVTPIVAPVPPPAEVITPNAPASYGGSATITVTPEPATPEPATPAPAPAPQ